MSNRQRVIDFISRFPGKDDDEISSSLSITPRQAINAICRSLAKDGAILRIRGASGKLVNYTNDSTPTATPPSVKQVTRVPDHAISTTEWFWEGNVSDTIESFLRQRGWSVVSKADTRSRARGVDLHVKQQNREILIEVKGYPSNSYRDPSRAGELKPTQPTLQAQHWFAGALLKALRMQYDHPQATVALGFPDFPRYRALFRETETALEKLGIVVLFANEKGGVEVVGL